MPGKEKPSNAHSHATPFPENKTCPQSKIKVRFSELTGLHLAPKLIPKAVINIVNYDYVRVS